MNSPLIKPFFSLREIKEMQNTTGYYSADEPGTELSRWNASLNNILIIFFLKTS